MKHFVTSQILLFVVLCLTSCHKTPNNIVSPVGAGDPVIRPTQVEIEADADGGSFVIEYTVENPVENALVTAETETDWIKNMECVGNDKITLDIPQNLTLKKRSGIVKILYKYDDNIISSVIKVSQGRTEKPDTDYTYEECAEGRIVCHGIQTSDPELMLYALEIISEPYGSNGSLSPNSMIYRLAIYSKSAPNGLDCRLPDGIYKVGGQAPEENCVNTHASNIYLFNDIGKEYEFERTLQENQGYVTILNTENGQTISGLLTDSEGETHYFTYSDNIESKDDRYLSTLLEDVDINLTNNKLYGYFQGVKILSSTADWNILVVDSKTGEGFQLYICTEKEWKFEQGLPVGTFTTEVYKQPGELTRGIILQNWMIGSWFVTMDDAGYIVTPSGPINEGTVEISKDEEGKYTVKIEAEDDRENSLKGTWRGIPILEDISK